MGVFFFFFHPGGDAGGSRSCRRERAARRARTSRPRSWWQWCVSATHCSWTGYDCICIITSLHVRSQVFLGLSTVVTMIFAKEVPLDPAEAANQSNGEPSGPFSVFSGIKNLAPGMPQVLLVTGLTWLSWFPPLHALRHRLDGPRDVPRLARRRPHRGRQLPGGRPPGRVRPATQLGLSLSPLSILLSMLLHVRSTDISRMSRWFSGSAPSLSRPCARSSPPRSSGSSAAS
jgi:hypothetical protein